MFIIACIILILSAVGFGCYLRDVIDGKKEVPIHYGDSVEWSYEDEYEEIMSLRGDD